MERHIEDHEPTEFSDITYRHDGRLCVRPEYLDLVVRRMNRAFMYREHPAISYSLLLRRLQDLIDAERQGLPLEPSWMIFHESLVGQLQDLADAEHDKD